jgi:hypothetical protein
LRTLEWTPDLVVGDLAYIMRSQPRHCIGQQAEDPSEKQTVQKDLTQPKRVLLV